MKHETRHCYHGTHTDLPGLRDLARHVEPLFGPMADDPGFIEALNQALGADAVMCVADHRGLQGGVVVDREHNEIAWLAVHPDARGKGLGLTLVHSALELLNTDLDVRVQTFAPDIPEGQAARRLYRSLGFEDREDAGPNPAGVPTVIMVRPAP